MIKWALVILLTLVFVYTGITKLAGPPAGRWDARLVRWGYPAGTAAWIGILEIVSGLALLIPRSRRLAAATIIVIMTGALITHLVHGELPRIIPALVLGGLAFVVWRSCRHR